MLELQKMDLTEEHARTGATERDLQITNSKRYTLTYPFDVFPNLNPQNKTEGPESSQLTVTYI